MRSYGKVQVKRTKPTMAEIPDDCGYMQKFKYNIDMASNGIMGDCIEWCQVNCKGKWGWWFEPVGEIQNPARHWENQNAHMSFQYKKDAARFLFAIGFQSMGNRD